MYNSVNRHLPLHPSRSSFLIPDSFAFVFAGFYFRPSLHPFFPSSFLFSPRFRSHRTEYRIRGLGERESSWPHRRSDANDLPHGRISKKRGRKEEEEGWRKKPKQKQTVVNRAQTSGARVPVSLVHIGSNLQTRPCHVAGKRFAYLLFSLRRIVPLRSRYFSSYLYVVINNACNSPP